MPIINSTFFNVGELSLANVTQGNVAEKLTYFITKYEKECLTKALGYPLYKLFINNPDEQRMLDLLNGVDYQLNGKLTNWQGLVHDTNLSLIANYIYWFIQKDATTHTTGSSIAKVNGAASVSVSPGEKMLSAWNWMSDEVSSLICFLRNKKDDANVLVYPEFDLTQCLKTSNVFRPITLLM